MDAVTQPENIVKLLAVSSIPPHPHITPQRSGVGWMMRIDAIWRPGPGESTCQILRLYCRLGLSAL